MNRRISRSEDPSLLKLRKQEKAIFRSLFRYSIIESIYRDKFFALFGSRCYKCGEPPPLEIDHHVPLALGGQLIPGNLVALCSRCNNIKLDRHPEDFYSISEIERLAPLLELQRGLFDFRFDVEAWEHDKIGYLVSLGLDPHEAWAVFYDPKHRYFMGEYPEPEVQAPSDIYDEYTLIRPLLDDYKTELQILLALAKQFGKMPEVAWDELMQFFKCRSCSFSAEEEKLLRKYTKHWGEETEQGFQVRCSQLDLTSERQRVCDDLFRAAVAIVSTQTSDASKTRLEMLRQQLITKKWPP